MAREQPAYLRSMMAFSSAGVVLFTMTTAPWLGLTWMVNSLLVPRSGVRLERVTVMSTCSPGSTKSPEPITQLVDQVQLGVPLPVQLTAWSLSR